MAKPGRGSDQFPLRFPEGMRDRIKASADKNSRSMNAEIIKLIEEGYEQRDHFEWLNEQHRASHEDDMIEVAMRQQDQEFQDEYAREQSSTASMKEMRDEMARLGERLDLLARQLPVLTTEDIFQAIRDEKSKATKDEK